MTKFRKKRARSVSPPRAVWLVSWIVLCFFPWIAFSQGRLFDDDNFDSFFDDAGQQFDDNLEKEWQAFEQFLEKEWEQFEIQAGIRPYRESKPQDPPALQRAADEPIQLNPVDPGGGSTQASSGSGESTPQFRPAMSRPGVSKTVVSWLGSDWVFEGAQELAARMPRASTATEDVVRASWESLTTPPGSSGTSAGGTAANVRLAFLSTQLLEYREAYRLNDWAVLLLADRLTDALFGPASGASGASGASPGRSIFLWALLRQARMDVRLGLANGRAFLFFASRSTVHETPFLTLDSRRYFLFEAANSSHTGATSASQRRYRTYSEPGAATSLRPVDFDLSEPIFFGETRFLSKSFTYNGQVYKIDIPLHASSLELMAQYPQTEFAIFLGAGMSEETAAALKAQFSDLLTGLSPEQAINVLLRFVQTAFEYQTDDENYGRENYLFAQETLTAAASDCEDRVALMAWLVANVLELPADRVALSESFELRGLHPWQARRRYEFPGKIRATPSPTPPISTPMRERRCLNSEA